ncbi:MAG: tetratricopeptide repeat protein [Elusimicrobiota bacterium]|nr:tetratricopeptide repeat protein [Elusimicrobiota bacterium]
MKRLLRSIAIVAAAAAFFSGQAAAEPKAKTGLLTNARIIAMLRSGASEGIILSLIKQFPEKLDGGPDALVELREAGASNKVLLAVRRSTLAARQEEAAPEPGPGSAGQAAETESDQAAQEGASGTPEGSGLVDDGRWSIGLGYPFLAVKYDFSDYAGEGKFITRRGIQAYAARGYWNFLKAAPWTVYTGLEAGYVRFGSVGSGAELSPFFGGAYALGKDFSLSADISPTLLFFPGGGTHFGLDEIGWVINFGVYIRLPAPAPKSAEANDPAPKQRESDVYKDYLNDAKEAVSRKDYAGAGRIYAKAMAAVSGHDERRVFLFERRGWLAMKEGDEARARDYYLAAISAARQTGSYDTNAVNAYCGLAYYFEKLGNVNVAINYYKRALEICASETTRREIEKNLYRLDPEGY